MMTIHRLNLRALSSRAEQTEKDLAGNARRGPYVAASHDACKVPRRPSATQDDKPSSLFLLLLLLLVIAPSAHAQSILLKTGQTIETKGLRRSGDMVLIKVQVGGSSGEVGYRASTIAKIAFPEPPQLKTAAAFLSQGQPEKALADIEPVIKYYEPFRDLPGNWWATAALLKISALNAMRLEKAAEKLADEIRKSVSDPETVRAAQLQLVAGFVRRVEYDKALQLCDTVIKESTKAELLAEAWVHKGDALLAQRLWDGAVLAYLHVPVFYEDEKLWMPPALLGSARAFRGLEDFERARRSLEDLSAQYPKSAQAEIGRAELQRLPK